LRFFPRKYLDWTNITPLKNALWYENICIKAKIVTPIEEMETRSGITIYKFLAEDSSGRFSVSLFNQKFLASKLNFGCEYLFYGKFEGSYILKQMSSPIIKEANYNGIEPIYNASKNMSSAAIQKLVKAALSECDLPEIQKDIEERDKRDMNRKIAPLRQAEDAVLIDSSEIAVEEVVKMILQIFREKVVS
jgi:RecG-like helicase